MAMDGGRLVGHLSGGGRYMSRVTMDVLGVMVAAWSMIH